MRPALFLITLFLGMTSSAHTTGPGMCPVMPGEPALPAYFIVHEGRTIHFCCNRCRIRFERDPDRYLASTDMVAGALPAGPTATVTPAAAAPQAPFWARTHVMWIHFPIALLLLAGLLELLRSMHSERKWEHATGLVLGLALLGGGAAAVTGWALADGLTQPAETANHLKWHRWTGVLVITANAVAVLFWRWRRNEDLEFFMTTLFRIALVAAIVAVAVNAHLGGSLVHGPDYLLP